jgi:hypothetical protein
MAPVANFLLKNYGWKGTNIIFAGLCLNCCVFGALMRPLMLNITEPTPEKNLTVQFPDNQIKRGSISNVGAPPPPQGALGLPAIPSGKT